MRMRQDIGALMREIQTKPTVPKYKAGRVFGWGRRATDKAVLEKQMPIIEGPKESVSTAWIRRQLQIEES